MVGDRYMHMLTFFIQRIKEIKVAMVRAKKGD